MISIVQQGSSLGSCLTFPPPNSHYKPSFGSLTLCQVSSGERQRQISLLVFLTETEQNWLRGLREPFCRANFIAWYLRYPEKGIPTGTSIFCTYRTWTSICEWLFTLKWPCIKSYLVGCTDKCPLLGLGRGVRNWSLDHRGLFSSDYTCFATQSSLLGTWGTPKRNFDKTKHFFLWWLNLYSCIALHIKMTLCQILPAGRLDKYLVQTLVAKEMYNGLTFPRTKQYKTIHGELKWHINCLSKVKRKIQELHEILRVHYWEKVLSSPL